MPPTRILRVALALATSASMMPAPAAALRRAARLDEGVPPQSAWTAGAECEVTYYNACTGWTWVWEGPALPGQGPGWRNRERVGVVLDTCCDQAQLTSTWTYFATGSPCSYGYSMVSIQAVDTADCPSGIPITQHLRCPSDGWNFDLWDVPVPSRFAIVQELRTDWLGAPVVLVTTDHPAARDGEAAACGTCYPASRPTHSYYWGAPAAPLCPGDPFFDGTCNAEILLRAAFACATDVEPRSWAGIKSMYR